MMLLQEAAAKADPKLSDQILQRLDTLAKTLGTTTEYLWGILVKRGFAEGIADLVLATLFFTLVGLAAKVVFKVIANKKAREVGYKDSNGYYMASTDFRDSECAAMTISIILGAIMLILGFVSLNEGIIYVSAPESYAAEQVLKLMGK